MSKKKQKAAAISICANCAMEIETFGVEWKTKLNRKPLQYWTQIPNQIQRQSLSLVLWFYDTIEWVQVVFSLFFHLFFILLLRFGCSVAESFVGCISLWIAQVRTFCCCCKIMFVRMAVRVRQVTAYNVELSGVSPIFHFFCYFSTDYLIICRMKGGKYFNAFCWCCHRSRRMPQTQTWALERERECVCVKRQAYLSLEL